MLRRARIPILVVVVIAVAVAIAVVWGLNRSASTTSEASADTASAGPTSVAPTAPAHSSEAARSDAPSFVATDPPMDTRGPVDVTVTYAIWDASAGEVQASGFVANVLESGGTCVLTLVRGSSVVTVDGTGTADVASTSCGLLTVPSERLAVGTWDATLSYHSANRTGKSLVIQVEVPKA